MITDLLPQSADYLFAQTFLSAVFLFWFTVIFEIPRYAFTFLTLFVVNLGGFARKSDGSDRICGNDLVRQRGWKISVVVVGLNEADVLERCVVSLKEQTLKGFEIVIVSDGSTDGMGKVAADLVRRGLADRAICNSLRGGKSAGLNLAERMTRGDIMIVVDCDCSYDRKAIERIVEQFADERVGAVSGDVVTRNGGRSLISQFQELEYLMSISLGKLVADMLDQVVCISGAFGAFRKTAMESVGGLDVGGGEDLDLTMRLRNAGWKIRFEPRAICYTDVPVNTWDLVRQRLRWERDSVRIRYRKHLKLMNPFSERFHLFETLQQLDFLAFNVVAAFAFPVYILWLFLQYGEFAFVILIALQLGLLVLDVFNLIAAIGVTRRWHQLRLFPYLIGFSIFTSYFMRLVRLWAYFEEWVFVASERDNFVPIKVRAQRKW